MDEMSRKKRSQPVRRLAREAVVKALFAVDLGGMAPRDALDYVLEDFDLPPGAVVFARELMDGVMAHKAEVDAVISEFAVGWRIERMPAVDRNILRLAVYEISFRDDIPAGASVNEAVELAKRYGDEDTPKFVNGVLGEVVRRRAALMES